MQNKTNKLNGNYSVASGDTASGNFPIDLASNVQGAAWTDYWASKIAYWNTWGGSWFPTDVLRLYYEKNKTTEDANIYNIIYFAKFVGESSGYLPIPGFFQSNIASGDSQPPDYPLGVYFFDRYPYGRPDSHESTDEVDESKWIQYYNGLQFNSSNANSLPSLGQLSTAFHDFYLGVFSITNIRQMWYCTADTTGNFGSANALVKVRVAYKCDPPYFKNGNDDTNGETPYWIDTLYYYTIDQKYYYDSELYESEPSIPNPVDPDGSEANARFANAMAAPSTATPYLTDYTMNYNGTSAISGFVEDFAPEYWAVDGIDGSYILTSTKFFLKSRDDGVPGGGKCQIACPYSGNIQFTWAFKTFDVGGPTWDPFTFFINSDYMQLSDNSTTESGGTKMAYVNKGDLIGFEENAIDGILGFGQVNISAFSFDIDLIKTTIAGVDPVYPSNVYQQSNIILNLNTKYFPAVTTGPNQYPVSLPKTVKLKIDTVKAGDVGDNEGTVHYKVSFVDQLQNKLPNIAGHGNLAIEFSFNSFTIDPVSDNLKGYIYLNKYTGLLNPSNIVDAMDNTMYFNLNSYYTDINAVIYDSYSNKILSNVANSSITGIPYTNVNNQIRLYNESQINSLLLKNKNLKALESSTEPTFDISVKLFRLPQLVDTTAIYEESYLDIISMSDNYTYESSGDYSENFVGNIMFYYRTHDSLSNMVSNILLLNGDLNANMITQIDYEYIRGTTKHTFTDKVHMKQENPGYYYIDYVYPEEQYVLKSTDKITKIDVNVYNEYSYIDHTDPALEPDGVEVQATRLFYKGSYNSYNAFNPPIPAKPYGNLSRIFGKLSVNDEDVADTDKEYKITMKPELENDLITFNYSIDGIKLVDLFTTLPVEWDDFDSSNISNVFLKVSTNIGPYIKYDSIDIVSPSGLYTEYIELDYKNNIISGKNKMSDDPIFVKPGNVLLDISWTLYVSDGDLATDETVPHVSVLSGTHSYVGLSCLLKGTKVRAINGFKKIEELKVGDYVISHLRKPVRVIKTDSWTVKWKQEISKGNRVYVLENSKTKTFISSYHKFMRNDKLVAACDANLRLARKEEICNEKDEYELFHIQIEDHEINHLLVNGDNIVESWDGKFSDEKFNRIAAL